MRAITLTQLTKTELLELLLGPTAILDNLKTSQAMAKEDDAVSRSFAFLLAAYSIRSEILRLSPDVSYELLAPFDDGLMELERIVVHGASPEIFAKAKVGGGTPPHPLNDAAVGTYLAAVELYTTKGGLSVDDAIKCVLRLAPELDGIDRQIEVGTVHNWRKDKRKHAEAIAEIILKRCNSWLNSEDLETCVLGLFNSSKGRKYGGDDIILAAKKHATKRSCLKLACDRIKTDGQQIDVGELLRQFDEHPHPVTRLA